MARIVVKEICQYAVFEQDGIKLRREILRCFEKVEDVVLDFSGISLFATMFFNASIGWLVLRDGPDVISEKLSYENLSDLGQTTWQHSFENAIQVRLDPLYKQALSNYDDESTEER